MGAWTFGYRTLEEDELTTVSKPFPSTHPPPTSLTESKFPSALFLNFAQAIASCLSAIVYLGVQSWQTGSLGTKGWKGVLGINHLLGGDEIVKEKTLNVTTHNGQNGHSATTTMKTTTNRDTRTKTRLREKLPFLLLQVSIFQTLAGPIGFSALRHISYPTMVLGKVSFLISLFPIIYIILVGYRCFRLALGVSLQERNLEVK
jgi:UDP-galactose transporter B1